VTLHSGREIWSDIVPVGRAGARAHDDRKFVTALARGLDVLRAFTPTDGLLGNGEIAERTRLPKPTVTRLTYTLTKLGYLAYIDRLEKYQLAASALALGFATLANMRIRQVARPYMQELADYADASVSLGSRDRLNLIYVEHCRAQSAVMLRLDIGSRIPVATTAMGRALIAALSGHERDWLLSRIKRQEGGRWPKIRAGITRAIKDLETRGFTTSVGDWQRDVSGVGVPLIPSDGSSIFVFNCGAPAFLLSRDKLENDLGPRLVNMVRNVQIDLNGR
jgi:DNA-binding IclR family transcriptional regulator